MAELECQAIEHKEQMIEQQLEMTRKDRVIRYMEDRGLNVSLAPLRPTKSTKLSDSFLFEGKDGQSFDDWITKVCIKLEANSDHYNTKLLRMRYI